MTSCAVVRCRHPARIVGSRRLAAVSGGGFLAGSRCPDREPNLVRTRAPPSAVRHRKPYPFGKRDASWRLCELVGACRSTEPIRTAAARFRPFLCHAPGSSRWSWNWNRPLACPSNRRGRRAPPDALLDDPGAADQLRCTNSFRRQQDIGFNELHRLAGGRRRKLKCCARLECPC
jgi:hypothetical protein